MDTFRGYHAFILIGSLGTVFEKCMTYVTIKMVT